VHAKAPCTWEPAVPEPRRPGQQEPLTSGGPDEWLAILRPNLLLSASSTLAAVSSISDSVLTNANPAGSLDGQIRLSGAIGILNASNIETLNVLVENSSLSDFTAPSGAMPIAAVTVTHPADKKLGTAAIDLGGGPLGSRGHNRFVKNAGLDVSVSNANAGTAPIRVDAARNYWGGGPPVIASTAPGAPKPSEGVADVAISGNVTFTPPAHLTSDPAR
jgi:hypothetical protein